MCGSGGCLRAAGTEAGIGENNTSEVLAYRINSRHASTQSQFPHCWVGVEYDFGVPPHSHPTHPARKNTAYNVLLNCIAAGVRLCSQLPERSAVELVGGYRPFVRLWG